MSQFRTSSKIYSPKITFPPPHRIREFFTNLLKLPQNLIPDFGERFEISTHNYPPNVNKMNIQNLRIKQKRND